MSSTTAVDGLWVRRFTPEQDTAARVVCLPHAGGSASFYAPMARALASAHGVDVVCVQYPGRQDRRGEPVVDDIGDLADAVSRALLPLTDVPVFLFGHSMGAVVAFEVALRLQREAGITPNRIFASGRRAPSRYRDENVHQRDDDGIVEELRLLSGTDADLLADEEVRRMVLPALRGDYRAIETYRHIEGCSVTCPITVLTGDADPKTSLEDAGAWASHTTADCEVHVFAGDHFFLVPRQEEVVELMRDRCLRR